MVDQTMQAWRGTGGRHALRPLKPAKPLPTVNLAAAILPWAKEFHPEKYADTIRQARNDARLRRYLIRLIEIRWDAEPEWRREVPLAVVDETALTKDIRMKSGRVLKVGGKLTKGSCDLRWVDLRLEPEDFRLLVATIATLDMEIAR